MCLDHLLGVPIALKPEKIQVTFWIYMLRHTNTQQDVYVAYKQRFEFLVRYKQTIFMMIGWWRVRKPT
jgi:glucose-6-phosphate isomerase